MYTVRVSLGKPEQLILCYNRLNSFNGTDWFWALRARRKSLSRVILIFLVSISYS